MRGFEQSKIDLLSDARVSTLEFGESTLKNTHAQANTIGFHKSDMILGAQNEFGPAVARIAIQESLLQDKAGLNNKYNS